MTVTLSAKWQRDALCREYPHLDFIGAERNSNRTIALQVCGRCLVMQECRADALADHDLVGIWGGTDSSARRAMRRNRDTPRGGLDDGDTAPERQTRPFQRISLPRKSGPADPNTTPGVPKSVANEGHEDPGSTRSLPCDPGAA